MSRFCGLRAFSFFSFLIENGFDCSVFLTASIRKRGQAKTLNFDMAPHITAKK